MVKKRTGNQSSRKKAPSTGQRSQEAGWVDTIYENQTARVIIAEMLIAAAGAAAAVLMTEKGRESGRAAMDAGRETLGQVRDAGGRAAKAASGAVTSTIKNAGKTTSTIAKKLGVTEQNQHDLAAKALKMKTKSDIDGRPEVAMQPTPKSPKG